MHRFFILNAFLSKYYNCLKEDILTLVKADIIILVSQIIMPGVFLSHGERQLRQNTKWRPRQIILCEKFTTEASILRTLVVQCLTLSSAYWTPTFYTSQIYKNREPVFLRHFLLLFLDFTFNYDNLPCFKFNERGVI